MNLPDIYKRVLERLKVVGLTAAAAGKLAGKRDAIRNIKRGVEKGRLGVSTATIKALAPVLQCTPEYLLHGVQAPSVSDGEDAPMLNAEQALAVRLVFQALLGLAMEDPVPQDRLKDPSYQAALSRIASQYAASRIVHEAAARDEGKAIEAVRLAIKMQQIQ